MLSLSILYRGPLAACNYACGYCPLTKDSSTADHRADEKALEQLFRLGRRPS